MLLLHLTMYCLITLARTGSVLLLYTVLYILSTILYFTWVKTICSSVLTFAFFVIRRFWWMWYKHWTLFSEQPVLYEVTQYGILILYTTALPRFIIWQNMISYPISHLSFAYDFFPIWFNFTPHNKIQYSTRHKLLTAQLWSSFPFGRICIWFL